MDNTCNGKKNTDIIKILTFLIPINSFERRWSPPCYLNVRWKDDEEEKSKQQHIGSVVVRINNDRASDSLTPGLGVTSVGDWSEAINAGHNHRNVECSLTKEWTDRTMPMLLRAIADRSDWRRLSVSSAIASPSAIEAIERQMMMTDDDDRWWWWPKCLEWNSHQY